MEGVGGEMGGWGGGGEMGWLQRVVESLIDDCVETRKV